jgi:DNA-binding transcriptional MerR regulator/methylmalonyl-CoA mutase cobalamin-binding subunit
MKEQINYSIKIAAQRSGLTAHVIRIWEKRYEAVTPQRTASGRRLYSPAQIERLKSLSCLTQAGHSIGHIANLSDEQLQDMASETPTEVPQLIPPPEQSVNERTAQAIVERCMGAVTSLDPQALDIELRRAALQFDHAKLITHIIEPFMSMIGQQWREGNLRIASEHLASVVVRSFIDSIRTTLQVPDDAPNLLVTTPLGQMHELGALFVSALAATEGWQTTYLGCNISAADIAVAAQRQGARAIALSIVYSIDKETLRNELSQLRQHLGRGAVIIAGGAGASQCRDILEHVDAIYVDQLNELRPTLSALRLNAA